MMVKEEQFSSEECWICFKRKKTKFIAACCEVTLCNTCAVAKAWTCPLCNASIETPEQTPSEKNVVKTTKENPFKTLVCCSFLFSSLTTARVFAAAKKSFCIFVRRSYLRLRVAIDFFDRLHLATKFGGDGVFKSGTARRRGLPRCQELPRNSRGSKLTFN